VLDDLNPSWNLIVASRPKPLRRVPHSFRVSCLERVGLSATPLSFPRVREARDLRLEDTARLRCGPSSFPISDFRAPASSTL